MNNMTAGKGQIWQGIKTYHRGRSSVARPTVLLWLPAMANLLIVLCTAKSLAATNSAPGSSDDAFGAQSVNTPSREDAFIINDPPIWDFASVSDPPFADAQKRLLSQNCYPFFILAKPLIDQVYTLTDYALFYQIEPWTYWPDTCQIEYKFTVQEQPSAEFNEINFDDYIYQDMGSGSLEFQANDLDLLQSPTATEKTYTITISGSIGFFFPLYAEKTMKLTVRNPCYDANFVHIEPVATPQLTDDYTLFQNVKRIAIKPFEVVTKPLENHQLCGDIVHRIFLDKNELDMRTMPVAFDRDNMNLYMYAVERKLVGQHELTVEAQFVNFPDLVFEKSYNKFSILDNPCAFDKLTVKPGPLQNITTFFNKDSITQNFNVNDFVTRSDYSHECGGLVVEFSHLEGEPLQQNLFNYTQNTFTVKYQPYKAKTRGGYIIQARVYLADWPRGAVTQTRSIDWLFVKVKDPCIDLDIRDRPTLCMTQNHISGLMPEWLRQLSDQYISLGGDYTYEMGPPVDGFNRPIDVTVTLRRASPFMSYQRVDNSLVIDGSKMTDLTTAYYQVTVEVIYEDIFQILQYHKRHIQFIVTHLAIPKVKAHHKLYFMHDADLPFYFDDEAKAADDAEGGNDRPQPFFIGLTEFGQIKLGWDQRIEQISDLKALKERKIARKIENTEIGEQFNDWAWITDRTISNDIAKYELKPAIEIVYQNQKSNKAKDEVKILGVTLENISEQTMDIQAEFENPNSVGQDDKLLVIFWRNEMFKSKANGQNVKFATSIITPIFRQIDEEQAEEMDLLASYLIMITILTALFMVSLAIYMGSLATLWIFLNAMQLVTYTVLLQTPMPSNASYFMGQLLNLLRLQVFELQPFAQETSSSILNKLNPTGELAEYYQQMNESEQSSVLILLQSLRFYPSLLKNLTPIITVLGLLFAVWLVMCLHQLVLRLKKRVHKCSMLFPTLCNSLIRFCYVTFLEVSICCQISLSLASQDQDFFSALAIVLIQVILIGLLLVLFCKGGPYLRMGTQGYEPRNVWNSLCCWQARKITVDVKKIGEQIKKAKESQKAAGQDSINDENSRLKPATSPFAETLQIIVESSSQSNDSEDNEAVSKSPRAIDSDRKLLSDMPFLTEEKSQSMQEHHLAITLSKQKNEQDVSLEIVQEDVEDENGTCVRRQEEASLLNLGLGANVKYESALKEQQHLEGGEALASKRRHILIPGARQHAKKANEARFRHEVRKRLILEDLVTVNDAYKTLFSGLKLGHPENVAVVHPLVFLLRRGFYSVGIIYLGRYGVMTLSVMQIICLFQICYSLEYRQWRSSLLNFQHLANEVFLYCILLLELCISAHEEMGFKAVLGTALIWMIVLAFILNLLVCLCSAFAYFYLLQKRRHSRVKPTVIEQKLVRQTTILLTRLSTMVMRKNREQPPDASASRKPKKQSSANYSCEDSFDVDDSLSISSLTSQNESQYAGSNSVYKKGCASGGSEKFILRGRLRPCERDSSPKQPEDESPMRLLKGDKRSRNFAEEVNEKESMVKIVKPKGKLGVDQSGESSLQIFESGEGLANRLASQENLPKTRQRLGSYILHCRKNTVQVMNELLKDNTPALERASEKSNKRASNKASEQSMYNTSKWNEELNEMELERLKRLPKAHGAQEDNIYEKSVQNLKLPSARELKSNLNSSRLGDSQAGFLFTSQSKKICGEQDMRTPERDQAEEAAAKARAEISTLIHLSNEQKLLESNKSRGRSRRSSEVRKQREQEDIVVDHLIATFTDSPTTPTPKAPEEVPKKKHGTPWALEQLAAAAEADANADHKSAVKICEPHLSENSSKLCILEQSELLEREGNGETEKDEDDVDVIEEDDLKPDFDNLISRRQENGDQGEAESNGNIQIDPAASEVSHHVLNQATRDDTQGSMKRKKRKTHFAVYTTGERDKVDRKLFDEYVPDTKRSITDYVDEFVRSSVVLNGLTTTNQSTTQNANTTEPQTAATISMKMHQDSLKSRRSGPSTLTAQKYAEESKKAVASVQALGAHKYSSVQQNQSRIFANKKQSAATKANISRLQNNSDLLSVSKDYTKHPYAASSAISKSICLENNNTSIGGSKRSQSLLQAQQLKAEKIRPIERQKKRYMMKVNVSILSAERISERSDATESMSLGGLKIGHQGAPAEGAHDRDDSQTGAKKKMKKEAGEEDGPVDVNTLLRKTFYNVKE